MTTISLLIALVSCAFAQFKFEKMPGATNAAVTAGDAADFLCNPLKEGVLISEKGEVWKKGAKPKKISGSISDFKSGSYIEYLECFIDGKEVIAAYKDSNGEDYRIVIQKNTLGDIKPMWKISILSSTLFPPKLDSKLLKLKVGNSNFTVDTEKGEVTETDSKGCELISRWPKLRDTIHFRLGAGCKKTP